MGGSKDDRGPKCGARYLPGVGGDCRVDRGYFNISKVARIKV